jgi:hypothetical protein
MSTNRLHPLDDFDIRYNLAHDDEFNRDLVGFRIECTREGFSQGTLLLDSLDDLLRLHEQLTEFIRREEMTPLSE